MMDPFDVFDAGRMAIFTDPTGAVLSVVGTARAHRRGDREQPGLLTWNELSTTDIDRRRASTPTFRMDL